ncbi:hypothetical protein B0H16DRAFT_1494020 [Mycena metata]|uniref:Uncharacterized protein n=1 Tax=Mycena metata TaxID=1033252 RepID=A0AAD7KC54_9AGAR|nr:hypothetical protein B0H16DRAFT_1494020 [Mycena metata]
MCHLVLAFGFCGTSARYPSAPRSAPVISPIHASNWGWVNFSYGFTMGAFGIATGFWKDARATGRLFGGARKNGGSMLAAQ